MKVLRYRPSRRPEFWNDSAEYKLKRKALLVGIQYDGDEEEDEQANALRGPHQDVLDMRQLLIDCYGYSPDDIVVLIDSNEPGQIRPTKANMTDQIQKLVEDAQPGDHFFFHYAGHTLQVENKRFTEEDGMDECIIPCDGEEAVITDNELRRYLVDSLPLGSQLVAIFDSCHSASLLDLQHFRCNRVYVPWVSKGIRQTDSPRSSVVRRRAMEVSTRHVYQTRRVSKTRVQSRKTTIDHLLTSLPEYKTLSVRTRSLTVKSDYERWYDSLTSPIQRTTSPEPMYPCTGYCPPSSPMEANVISLAACKDYQFSWEDVNGSSMTQELIRILKSNPHPTLRDLLTNVAHNLHNFYLRLHAQSKLYRRRLREVQKRRAERGLPPLRIQTVKPEMTNFQDPQMSSHRPLDMSARWEP